MDTGLLGLQRGAEAGVAVALGRVRLGGVRLSGEGVEEVREEYGVEVPGEVRPRDRAGRRGVQR
jgi:hypothetical protein